MHRHDTRLVEAARDRCRHESVFLAEHIRGNWLSGFEKPTVRLFRRNTQGYKETRRERGGEIRGGVIKDRRDGGGEARKSDGEMT